MEMLIALAIAVWMMMGSAEGESFADFLSKLPTMFGA